jgi:PhzF family phenazine biosynthesis protein
MDYQVVNVFAAATGGGNPAPVVVHAAGMTDAEMQALAVSTGHESAFVFPAPIDSDLDFEFKFWVPQHEMSMCAHATIGAVWLLHRLGLVTSDELRIGTSSGNVTARIDRAHPEVVAVAITQPEGTVDEIAEQDTRRQIIEVLGIEARDVADLPILNSKTSRVKTLIPIRSLGVLRELVPRFDEVESVCTQLGSTGLYPYVVLDREAREFEARQFPQSSGYREDPATGIAAAALAFGLLHAHVIARSGGAINVMQGVSIARPSRITVTVNPLHEGGGCWVSGSAELDESQEPGGR